MYVCAYVRVCISLPKFEPLTFYLLIGGFIEQGQPKAHLYKLGCGQSRLCQPVIYKLSVGFDEDEARHPDRHQEHLLQWRARLGSAEILSMSLLVKKPVKPDMQRRPVSVQASGVDQSEQISVLRGLTCSSSSPKNLLISVTHPTEGQLSARCAAPSLSVSESKAPLAIQKLKLFGAQRSELHKAQYLGMTTYYRQIKRDIGETSVLGQFVASVDVAGTSPGWSVDLTGCGSLNPRQTPGDGRLASGKQDDNVAAEGFTVGQTEEEWGHSGFLMQQNLCLVLFLSCSFARAVTSQPTQTDLHRVSHVYSLSSSQLLFRSHTTFQQISPSEPLYFRTSHLKSEIPQHFLQISFAMSKTAVKKLHWRSNVQDTFIPLLGASGDLGVAVGGGADYGEFPFVTSAPGGSLTVGDIILEIGGTPVLGMTLGDVRGVINSCPQPIRIKTVSPGSTLCKDLRLYLSKCFTPGSVDSQLQQVIRENLYLRAVPCTTRQPRDGEISGVDYNFVSIEEFFSLEESGALLESGKFKGNYYGTPRPVHIGPESPPITYQEHRNLLRNFRTRSKSLSNLEKSADEGRNSEDDLGKSGSAGVSIPIGHRSPGRPRASSSGGEGHGVENGIIGSRRGARIRGMMPDHWEQAFSDPGESLYIGRSPRRTSWLGPRPSSRESNYKNEWFTDLPEDLRGFPVHAHLIKGSRGFGFNIVGGSRPREFLQVYSVTASGPSTLKTADILVYINDACVLGMSHKEAVEMLKSVPVGHSIDIEVRRGYPMLYNPDGRPKQPSPRLLDAEDRHVTPTTTQPQPLHQLPRLSTPSPQSQLFNGYHSDRGYVEHGVTLDANGNATSYASRQPPPYRRSSVSNAAPFSPVRPPRSHRSLARLQSLDPTLASQSDSEVVSAVGSHRASMIRNHNNNSLTTPQHHLRYGTSKSSESDLSTCTMPGARLPLPESPRRPSSSSGGHRSAHSHLFRPQTPHLRPPLTRESPHHHGVNGFHGNTSPTASPSSVSSPGAMSVGSGFGGLTGGELVPVALAQTEGDRGLGFSLMAGGSGGRLTVVERVFDRKQCNSLQPGDAVVKINGADVQSLSLIQIQTILQEHTKQGEVTLLVYRGGTYHPSVSPVSVRRLPPPLLRPPPPPVDTGNLSLLPEALPVPRTATSNPPSPLLTSSSLIQSTSFLESIPVTLTMEPKDWIDIGLEDEAAGAGSVSVPDASLEKRKGDRTRRFRGFDVELRRKPGEGFGFVIASQDLENGKAASLLPHRFVTVRRGSPAAKSGQIRPGDRLEAVEGRSVVTLPHRELAQILRRAGNTLRLTIVPRPSTCKQTQRRANQPGSQSTI
ncbi:hypothetical protein CCH79_00006472 [Gambusia affinis]|uniref:MAGI family member, X-linked b n=1 Tax=Gambusia affinis TaxID=33528 RepID=A0A315WPS3_GAMAF|nr:hypothetical protein CCH79_00006472 [Gambusia affinis]